ncbi:MAG: amidohydrolase family protein, partial [Candidatus Hodarchaeota archaeon]
MIIDAHAHFASRETIENWLKGREITEGRRAVLQKRLNGLPELEKAAHMWAQSLELAKCDKALLMVNGLDITRRVLSLYPSKFIGCVFINPFAEMDDILDFIQKALDIGCKAVKFHVSGLGKFYPAERRYDPLWEFLEKNQTPTYFHFGITPSNGT